MRIFVTGATGFIGAAYAAEAIRRGHEVSALVRDPGAWRLMPPGPQLRTVVGDLSDKDFCRREMAAFRPEAVAHLAWAGVGAAARNSAVQVDNVAWSAGLFEAAAEAEVSVFVGIGSQAEYGPRTATASAGDMGPTTLYGEAKLATSRILTRMAQLTSTRLAWMRIFSIYGPGDHPYWMIPSLIGSLLAARRPSLTAGAQLWDFLYVTDAARALLDVTESSSSSGIYDLGSGQAPPLKATVSTLRDLIDPQLELGFGEIPYRPDQVMHLQADIGRLATEFGWRPRVSLGEGLRETVDWYRHNRWIFS